eukprot:1159569-Pelagomonas_calceolata.AAC.1
MVRLCVGWGGVGWVCLIAAGQLRRPDSSYLPGTGFVGGEAVRQCMKWGGDVGWGGEKVGGAPHMARGQLASRAQEPCRV